MRLKLVRAVKALDILIGSCASVLRVKSELRRAWKMKMFIVFIYFDLTMKQILHNDVVTGFPFNIKIYYITHFTGSAVTLSFKKSPFIQKCGQLSTF